MTATVAWPKQNCEMTMCESKIVLPRKGSTLQEQRTNKCAQNVFICPHLFCDDCIIGMRQACMNWNPEDLAGYAPVAKEIPVTCPICKAKEFDPFEEFNLSFSNPVPQPAGQPPVITFTPLEIPQRPITPPAVPQGSGQTTPPVIPQGSGPITPPVKLPNATPTRTPDATKTGIHKIKWSKKTAAKVAVISLAVLAILAGILLAVLLV